jgi:hypothetical protein
MKVSERQAIADRVVHFYAEISGCNKYRTVKHFEEEGLKRRTLYGIIQRYETRGTSMFRPKTGHPVTGHTSIHEKSCKKTFDDKPPGAQNRATVWDKPHNCRKH